MWNGYLYLNLILYLYTYTDTDTNLIQGNFEDQQPHKRFTLQTRGFKHTALW